jgi:tRNA nucleotidyltransferase (CCA-adding enzyme)
MALLLYRLSTVDRKSCQKRLRLGREATKRIREVQEIKERVPNLAQSQPASVLYQWLSPYSPEALLVVWAAEEEIVAQQIRRFHAELRDVRAILDGRYLIDQYGLKPGPLFGRLLDALRDARLNGLVETREDEEALLAQLLAEETAGRTTTGPCGQSAIHHQATRNIRYPCLEDLWGGFGVVKTVEYH